MGGKERERPGSAAGDWLTVAVLALMMVLAPGLGVPHEQMLQDTLKSIIVSFSALGAAAAFFWHRRMRQEPLRWHAAVALPLLLMAYALGSMAWSHGYLAGVETIRWFIFSLIFWLSLNSLTLARLPVLAVGIHAGAVLASLWAVLQFLVGFGFFPQGPHPASTFVNRNFFAEFAVCTLPFAAMLLAQARRSSAVALLSATSGLIVLAILMTGTRAALMALWLQLCVLLPYAAWLYRGRLGFSAWPASTRWMAAVVLVATVGGLGLVPSGDPKILEEGRGLNALERGWGRTGSISPSDASLQVRMTMWEATARMIARRPVAGVGAGAWENEIPLYQKEGEQLETDYYVHNEFLQLVAEYGVIGWAFLLGLAGWLVWAFAQTLLQRPRPTDAFEAPWRAALLCSLLSLFIVSSIGFPWRMASTGALFALCLGALAASDVRIGVARRWMTGPLPWRPAFAPFTLLMTGLGLVLAAYIAGQAAESERKIVRAAQLALGISASGQPNAARWIPAKAEMLTQIREGIAINPHYRKITPIVADELAKWGDWKNATPIWDSVLSSRPNIVAIMANAARGHAAAGEMDEAMALLARAKALQPRAPAIRALEIVLLNRRGEHDQALALSRQVVADRVADYELANAAFVTAERAGDVALAAEAVALRNAAKR
jgi:O-antigen ligase